MASVEPAAVRTVDVLHQPREGMQCRPQQQVHVSPHQAVSIDLDGEASGRSLEQLEISRVVAIVYEHFALVIAARHDVMQHSGCVKPKRAGHTAPRASVGPSMNASIFRTIAQTPNLECAGIAIALKVSVGSFRMLTANTPAGRVEV
jgi:hypothetical protein